MNKNSFELLPTGKPHVSYSEVKSWAECSYRHQLQHVKKIDLFKPSIHLDFGTAIHAACESFLKTRVMDSSITLRMLDDAWKKNEGAEGFDEKSLVKAKNESLAILAEVPNFMDTEFPEWEFIAAEEQLYESINPHPHAFKGFIDGVIKCKGKRGEDLVWVLDWKSSSRGWLRQKRQDKLTAAQLVLYKSFWSQKHNINLKEIRCAFVILKKQAKQGKHCELFAISVGDVTIKRNLKMVTDMVTSVKKGIALKNRNSCLYCDYHNTEHCK
jgi:hypothetical protein